MTKPAKPDHKAAFIGLRAGLASTLHAASLLPHPVWRPGWDKDNAQYAAEYLAPPAPDGIRRVSLLYSPADKGWHVEGVFMPCLDAAERLTHAANLGPNWIDALQGLPMRQNSPTGKSFLITRNHVKLRNRKYFGCAVAQIRCLMTPVYRDKRGARDRHERAVGCDGRRATKDERCLCVR